MKKLENYNVTQLTKKESLLIDGGTEPAEGSYNLGYSIGSWIRSAFVNFADNYSNTHIWGA